MAVESVNDIDYDEKNSNEKQNSSVFLEVQKYLPYDLIPKVTILLQDSGYITIKPMRMSRSDWSRFNKKVKQIGGVWISNNRFSHWSIPLPRTKQPT